MGRSLPAGRRSAQGRLAIVFIVLVAAAAIASRLPAWSMSALPLVLATSELSPLVALVALIGIPFARRALRTRPAARRVVAGLLLVAAIVTLHPLLQLAGVASRTSAQLEACGARPLSFADALIGLNAPRVRTRAVRYPAADGSPLELRLYDPENSTAVSRPVVVVVYGGAWRGGDPSQGERVSRALAHRGWLVAAIDYRHAPRHTFPAQLDDVRHSLALIRDSAAAWRADTTRLALLGRSAGGHLAELAAYRPDGAPRVRAVVAIYAPWDLAEGYRDVPVPDPIGVRTVIGNFVGGTPEQRPNEYRAASPASYALAGLPPTLLIYGSRDHLVKPRFNRDAATALRAMGNQVVEVELPWSEHGFDLVPAGLGERLAWAVEERFLSRALEER